MTPAMILMAPGVGILAARVVVTVVTVSENGGPQCKKTSNSNIINTL